MDEHMEKNTDIYKKAFEIAVRCARELNGTPELKEAYEEAQKDNRALNSFKNFCLEKAVEEISVGGCGVMATDYPNLTIQTEKRKSKLLPCPFCGGEAEYIKQGYLTGGYDYGRIKCQKCGITQTIPKVIDEATRDWNTRTPQKEGLTMVIEHKGYTLQQSDYNNHYMIIKDNKMVCHAQYEKKLTEDEARERIDFFIDLSSGKIKPKERGGD